MLGNQQQRGTAFLPCAVLYLTTATFSFTSTVATHLHQDETIMHMNLQFSAEDTKTISGLLSYSRQNLVKENEIFYKLVESKNNLYGHGIR